MSSEREYCIQQSALVVARHSDNPAVINALNDLIVLTKMAHTDLFEKRFELIESVNEICHNAIDENNIASFISRPALGMMIGSKNEDVYAALENLVDVYKRNKRK